MKFEVRNRYSGEVQFTAEIDCSEDAARSVKLGLAVIWAIENGVNLSGANLSGANLSWANLSGANLSWANLYEANLYEANLSGANLSWANLTRANLSGANLTRANLTRADLYRADLYRAKGPTGADLKGRDACISMGPMGSRNDVLVAWRYADGTVVNAGCFRGSIDEFAAAVRNTHGDSYHAQIYGYAIGLLRVWEKRED